MPATDTPVPASVARALRNYLAARAQPHTPANSRRVGDRFVSLVSAIARYYEIERSDARTFARLLASA